jgi:hypothetical protein
MNVTLEKCLFKDPEELSPEDGVEFNKIVIKYAGCLGCEGYNLNCPYYISKVKYDGLKDDKRT